MDLTTITNVSDLIEQNNTPEVDNVDTIMDTVRSMDLGVDEHYQLVKSLIQKLGHFHQTVIEDLKDGDDFTKLMIWIQDEKMLNTCWDIINDVQGND